MVFPNSGHPQYVNLLVTFSSKSIVFQVQYVDQGFVENIPVCHVHPVVLCETVPQLSVPCQINGLVPVNKLIYFNIALLRKVFASCVINILCHRVQVEGTWQLDAVALMKELLIGQIVSVHVIVS